MGKLIELVNERISYINKYLDSTKEKKDLSTLSSREKATKSLNDFKELLSLSKKINNLCLSKKQIDIKSNEYLIDNFYEVISVTIDKLIEHNIERLNYISLKITKLRDINNSNYKEEDEELIGNLGKSEEELSNYIQSCINVKDELDMMALELSQKLEKINTSNFNESKHENDVEETINSDFDAFNALNGNDYLEQEYKNNYNKQNQDLDEIIENNDLENDDLENDFVENNDLENYNVDNNDLENDNVDNNDLENDNVDNNDLDNNDLENNDLENNENEDNNEQGFLI